MRLSVTTATNIEWEEIPGCDGRIHNTYLPVIEGNSLIYHIESELFQVNPNNDTQADTDPQARTTC